MISVLMKDHDSFYVNGLSFFLSDLFLEELFVNTTFTTDFSVPCISQADVIVMSLCRGESLTCIPELLNRKRGLLIGVIENEGSGNSGNLPNCLADIIFIQRNENLSSIRRKILSRIEKNTLPNWKSRLQGCAGCLRQKLSPQQLRIMTGIYQGKSVEVIAREMNVTDKTVFSHKYLMMTKFNLCSDYDLLTFLKRWPSIIPYQTCFRTLRLSERFILSCQYLLVLPIVFGLTEKYWLVPVDDLYGLRE